MAAWKQSVTSAVGPFAPLGERTLLTVTLYEDPPNAPPGEYVVIQYRT